MNRIIPVLACACLFLGLTGKHAIAQRAVSTPSSQSAAPSAPATPPPPGMTQSNLVYGGEFNSLLQGLATGSTGNGVKGAISDDSDLDLYANYSDWLSAYSDIKLERQRNDNLDSYYPGSNAAFRSEGLTMRQLFLAARPDDSVTFYGGKIHPNFGSAFDQEPGNFYNFGSDYEQDERIGVGGEYLLPDTIGLHRLRVSLEAFMLDTSVLSESLLSRPGLDDTDPTMRPYRYTPGSFGPSNTGSLASYTLAFQGGEAERGLTYQISFTKEATDDPTGKTEWGQSIGASYDPTGDGIPFGERLGLTPFLEYTHFNNFQNNPGLSRHYLIGGATFTYVNWQLALAAGLRRTTDDANASGAAFTNAVAVQENKAWDHQENASLDYSLPPSGSLPPGVTLGFGVNHVIIAARGSWSFGPSLGYHRDF
jgi:hypothetical protein